MGIKIDENLEKLQKNVEKAQLTENELLIQLHIKGLCHRKFAVLLRQIITGCFSLFKYIVNN